MKWKVPTLEEKYGPRLQLYIKQWEYEKEWRPYFAWWPVKTIDNQKVWLEWVERKLDLFYQIKPSYTNFEFWEFRSYQYRVKI